MSVRVEWRTVPLDEQTFFQKQVPVITVPANDCEGIRIGLARARLAVIGYRSLLGGFDALSC